MDRAVYETQSECNWIVLDYKVKSLYQVGGTLKKAADWRLIAFRYCRRGVQLRECYFYSITRNNLVGYAAFGISGRPRSVLSSQETDDCKGATRAGFGGKKRQVSPPGLI